MQVIKRDEQKVHDVPGLRHLTLAGAGHGLRTLEVWEQTLAPGGGTPIHSHDCEEVFVILDGGGTVELETKRSPFSAGDTLIIPPNRVHRIANTGEEPLVYLAILAMAPVRLTSPEGVSIVRPWMTGD